MIRLLSIIILTASVIIAADSTDPPKAIQPIINKLNNNIIKQYKDYQKQQKTLIDTAIKELNAKAESLAKAGNLDDAIAVKKIIESLKADDYANTAVAQAEKNASDLLGDNSDIRKSLIGSWRVMYKTGAMKCNMTIDKNFNATAANTFGTLDENMAVNWNNGTTWTFAKTNDKWTVTAGDGPFTLIKDGK